MNPRIKAIITSLILQLCFINGIYVYALNVGKLKKSNVTLVNKTEQQQKLSITKQECCSVCHDTTITNEVISLGKNEQQEVTSAGILKEISSINQNTYLATNNSYEILIKSTNRSSTPSFECLDEQNMFSFTPNVIGRTDIWCGYLLPDNVSPNDFFTFINKQFNKNNIVQMVSNRNKTYNHIKIPKIIHQIWFGITGDIPLFYKQWQKQWKKQHPQWQMICWNKDLLQKTFPQGLVNQKTFSNAEQVRNYAKMADVARYEIVEKFGGLYIDVDTENYESVEPLHYLYDFYTSNESDDFLLVCNCLFAAKPRHPIMKECVRLIKYYEDHGLPEKLYVPPLSNHTHGLGRFTLFHTGPGITTKATWNAINTDNNVDIVFPSIYLCPRENPHIVSLCAHHFECPAKQKDQTWGDILIAHQQNK